MREYLFLLIGLFSASLRTRSDLVAENLLLRQQLAVLSRPTRRRPRLRRRDRLFWSMTRILRGDWRRHLVLVQPDTVIRWHRKAWRLFWRWQSRPLGRPRLSAEVRELIATMAADNPTWGSERIRGELLKLGIAVRKRTVQQYRRFCCRQVGTYSQLRRRWTRRGSSWLVCGAATRTRGGTGRRGWAASGGAAAPAGAGSPPARRAPSRGTGCQTT